MNLIEKNDMIDGNVADFIDNLTIQDEIVRYNGNLYYFYGIRFNEERHLYSWLQRNARKAFALLHYMFWQAF